MTRGTHLMLLVLLVAACKASPEPPRGDGGLGDGGAKDGGKADMTVIPNCRPDNCLGCCKNDTCVDGNIDQACGVGGIECDTCMGTTSCQQQQCATLCGPDTCAGCCIDTDNDGVKECQGGGDVHQCGKMGADCIDCGNGGLCSLGICVDPSCATSCAGCCDGATCRAGNTNDACGSGGATCDPCDDHNGVCSSSHCVIDPDSRWDVQLVSAELPPKRISGSNWDTFGQPDPYVIVETTDGTISTMQQSPTVDGTRTPSWTNYYVLTNVTARQLKHSFKQTMYDEDPDFDDYVGECYYAFDDAQFDNSTWTLTCPQNLTVMPQRETWLIRIRVYPH